jgi:hypothetical protein
MKYAAEMGSQSIAVIYVPGYIKVDSGIIDRIHRPTDRMEIA